MRIAPVPTLPEIRLYTAHPASGLWRFAELDEDGSRPSPPYWAYHWAGGAALARHILDRPETVTGGRGVALRAASPPWAFSGAPAAGPAPPHPRPAGDGDGWSRARPPRGFGHRRHRCGE